MPHRFENIDFKRTLASIDEETRLQLEQADRDQNAKDFERLKTNLSKGKCYLCNQDISYTDPANPCFHWLINPNIDISLLRSFLSKEQSFFRMYTYLAWVANSDTPLININDTFDYDKNKRIFEGTVRYKEIEWSFSLGKSDFEGHTNKTNGCTPHFHAQLKINGRTQIKYNQTHIPFHPSDFLNFELLNQHAVQLDASFASGIEELKNHVEVAVYHDNSVHFKQLVSCDTLITTIVLPGITFEHLEEIEELYSTTQLQIHEIIDKMNSEKGYDLKYLVYSSTREKPVEKNHRH